MKSLEDELRQRYRIKDSIKKYKGYKVEPPERTINRIEKAFDKIGLKISYAPTPIQFLDPYSPFQSGLAVLHPKENDGIELLRGRGKGVTPLLTRASATAEVIERFTGYGLATGQIEHYLSFTKLNSLWISRRKRNKKIESNFPFHYMDTERLIKEDFREKFESLAKSICYSITNDRFYSYPEEFISTLDGSNGLASGNTYEEATAHALEEVIERLVGFYVLDTLPKFNRISKESITHPTLAKLISSVENAGVTFEMMNFSNVFGIPVIITVFDHPDWNYKKSPYTNTDCEYPKICIGVETDPQDAAMRCFTEFLQVAERPSLAKMKYEYTEKKFLLSGIEPPEIWKLSSKTAGSFFPNGNPPMHINLRKYIKNSCKGTIEIQDIESLYDINLKVEIKRMVDRLKNHSIEVFVHNITHPVLGFPVVRVMISGGKGYFSKIPFVGYRCLLLQTNGERRSSYLNKTIDITFKSQPFHEIFKDGEWCISDDQTKLIELLIRNISFNGVRPPLWGKNIDKFYFLGLLYLKMKNYEKAKRCFIASLYQRFNDIPSLLGLAFVYSKTGEEKKYEDVIDHIKSINRGVLDVDKELKEMENPVIDPNPFELCDQKCKQKNKPYLCRQCFFNYVSEDVFMKDSIDELITKLCTFEKSIRGLHR